MQFASFYQELSVRKGGGVHPVLEAQRLLTFDYIASFCEQDSDES